MTGRLEGKIAAITGAASGIGRATARRFAAEGARVVLGDVRDDEGRALAEELGARAVFLRCDVHDEADIERLVQTAVTRWGRLDVMHNNAGGGGKDGSVLDLDRREIERLTSLLLVGPMLGTKHAARVMTRQGFGSIVQTASVSGQHPGSGTHIYSTAKAGLIHFTRMAAVELGPSGVRINAICPGVIATEGFGRAMGAEGEARMARALDAVRTVRRDDSAIPRTGEGADIAAMAVFLASDEAAWVTGQALAVDGGWLGVRSWDEMQTRRQALAAAYAGEAKS